MDTQDVSGAKYPLLRCIIAIAREVMAIKGGVTFVVASIHATDASLNQPEGKRTGGFDFDVLCVTILCFVEGMSLEIVGARLVTFVSPCKKVKVNLA